MPIKQFVPTPCGSIPVDLLCGWTGRPAVKGGDPELYRKEFDLWTAEVPRLRIIGGPPSVGRRSMLWELGRKILGTDPPNIAQLIGDCEGWGTKNAIQNVQFFPIANGQRDRWTAVYPPYLYACARVLVGNGQLGWADGSLGVWQAKAAEQYGAVPWHDPRLSIPEYCGQVARQWGHDGPPKELIPVGQKHIVKATALVKTWGDYVAALINGYPVTLSSNVGFDMVARSDGFMHAGQDWGHCMCGIGVDDDPGDPHACVLNSWGDLHGKLLDFKTGEQWPAGTLRVRKVDIERMLSEGDSFAFSAFQGFPAQELPADIGDLW